MITAIGCKSSANQIQKEGEEKHTLKRKEEKAKKEKKKKKKSYLIHVLIYTTSKLTLAECLFCKIKQYCNSNLFL